MDLSKMIDLSKLEKIKTPNEINDKADLESAIKYLRDTDWYVIRKLEVKQAIPDDVSKKRTEARDVISRLK